MNSSNQLNQFNQFMDLVLGDYGGRISVRKFCVDYKTAGGIDRNKVIMCAEPRNKPTDDATLVDKITSEVAKGPGDEGGRVTCIGEVDPLTGEALACLFIDREEMFESLKELGIAPPSPSKLKANMDKAGVHPVNYEDLIQ